MVPKLLVLHFDQNELINIEITGIEGLYSYLVLEKWQYINIIHLLYYADLSGQFSHHSQFRYCTNQCIPFIQDIWSTMPSMMIYLFECRRIETLSWLKLVTEKGGSIHTSTIPHYKYTELLDYISIKIKMSPILPSNIPPLVVNNLTSIVTLHIPPSHQDCNPQRMTHTAMLTDEDSHEYDDNLPQKIYKLFFPPIINRSFSKHDYTNWTILGHRFNHLHDEKLSEMCTKQLLEGIPTTFPVKNRVHTKRDCWICTRCNLHHCPHNTTINTDHLCPSQLIYMRLLQFS